MRHLKIGNVLACALALALPAQLAAQTQTIRADRVQGTTSITAGGSTAPTGTSARLLGLATSGGDQVLVIDSATGNVIRRILAKTDLPATTAYTDSANTFTLAQTFSAGLSTTTLSASGLASLNGGASATTLAASGLATFNNDARSLTYTSRTTGWDVTAAGAADFRQIYTDELHAREFIADLEMALNGGQTIAKSTVVLALNFTCPAAAATATLRVRDFPGFPNIRTFAVNDWVVLRSFSRTDGDADGNTDLTIGDCVGQVSAYADQTDNTQTWTFTRGSGGNAGSLSSGTVVSAESIVIDYGVSGQGFLLARANDGAEGANSPYWQINTWATSPVSTNMAIRMRCGNLNGAYGYVSAIYGCAFGDPSAANLTLEPSSGIRFRNGTTTTMQLTANELNLLNTGVIKSGLASNLATGAGLWLAANSGTPQFRVGNPASNYLSWDGTDLSVVSGAFTADANGVRMASSGVASFTTSICFDFASGSDPCIGGLTQSSINDLQIQALNSVVDVGQSSSGAAIGLRVGTTGTTQPRVELYATAGAERVNLSGGLLGTGVHVDMLDFDASITTPTLSTGYAGRFVILSAQSSPIASKVYLGDGSGWQQRWYSRTGSADTLRYTFDDRGRLGIGNINPAHALELSTDDAFKPTTSTWGITSDRRSKRNVRALASSLADIRRLRLVEFDHNGRFGTPNGAHGIGAIADEVAAIFPDAVRSTDGPDGPFLTMDWHRVFVANVKAVQELAAEVDALKREIARR